MILTFNSHTIIVAMNPLDQNTHIYIFCGDLQYPFSVLAAASASEPFGDDLEEQQQHVRKHYKEQRSFHRRRLRHHLTRRHLNDRHQLRFSQLEYRQTVPENIPLHTSILTVSCTKMTFEYRLCARTLRTFSPRFTYQHVHFSNL